MLTQSEINDLANADSDIDIECDIQLSKQAIEKKQQNGHQEQNIRQIKTEQEENETPQENSNYYANTPIEESKNYYSEEFQEYQSQSQSHSHQMKQNKKDSKVENKRNKQLTAIKEEQERKRQNVKNFNNYMEVKPALSLKPQPKYHKQKHLQQGSNIPPKDKKEPNKKPPKDSKQVEKSLIEENKNLKLMLTEKEIKYKKLEQKYNLLMTEKVQKQNSTGRELALEKKISFLQTKLEQMGNLNKLAEERDRYKTKLPKNPGQFIPEQQANRRELQLLQLIDKLKRRLLESDQSMNVLQKKLNEGAEHNDQLLRRMRRVEQLEYKIEKMAEQAQTDRGYINILKDKVKDLEKQVELEKDRLRKKQIQIKRLELGQSTQKDLLRQLEQSRRQKVLLEKSLKELSATMMGNVRKKYDVISNKIEDSGELLEPTYK